MKTAANTIVLSLACVITACTLSACGSEEPSEIPTQAVDYTLEAPQAGSKRCPPERDDPLQTPFSDGPPSSPATP